MLTAAQDVDLPTWVEWTTALTPLLTLVVAVVGGVVAVATLDQRRRADAKAEWWKRFAWASELVLADHPGRQEIGVRTLAILATSELVHDEELLLVDSTWGGLIDVARPRGPRATPYAEDESAEDESLVRPVATPSRAQVLAARGRAATDARLARPTDRWVADLAATPVDREPAGPG